jgi:hypothetical protein
MKTCNKGGEKGTRGKDPSLGTQTKPQKKGKPPRGRGTNHVPNPPPLTRNIKRLCLKNLTKIHIIVGVF